MAAKTQLTSRTRPASHTRRVPMPRRALATHYEYYLQLLAGRATRQR